MRFNYERLKCLNVFHSLRDEICLNLNRRGDEEWFVLKSDWVNLMGLFA